MIKWIYITFVTVILVILVIINYRFLYSPTVSELGNASLQSEEILKQLNYLKNEIHYNNADIRMQEKFPEGYVFMNALYGLTWCEIALKDCKNPGLCNNAVSEANFALNRLESKEAKATFNKNCNPPYGIFYQSWTNYLRSKILLLTYPKQDTQLVKNYLETCRLLASVLDNFKSPFPESYRNAAWPADVLPALVSLKIHDEIFPEQFRGNILQWLYKAKKRLDEKTGLFPHSVDVPSGNLLEGSRGASQSLIIRLLAELDSSFAFTEYKTFNRRFVDDILGITVVREYPLETSGYEDIDSGPVIFGAGSAATITAIGTARACGDLKLASALEKTIEVMGVPIVFNKKKKYLFGQLPIADMFIVWSKSSPVLIYRSDNHNFTFNHFSRNKILFVSVSVIVILLIPVLLRLKEGKTNRLPMK